MKYKYNRVCHSVIAVLWQLLSPEDAGAGTGVVEGTGGAVGFARMACRPTVQDQPVRQVGPLLRRETRGDFAFDMYRVGVCAAPIGTPA